MMRKKSNNYNKVSEFHSKISYSIYTVIGDAIMYRLYHTHRLPVAFPSMLKQVPDYPANSMPLIS